ncbi:MAG: EamA family transporter [Actinomycetota bacterium]
MAVLLGLVTAVAWAFANVFTQRASRIERSPILIMFWVLTICTVAVLPVALVVDGGEGPWTPRALAWPVAAGVCANVGFFLLLRALRSGNLSVVAPIIALEGGVATLISIGLGERPTPLTGALLLVAVVGTVLVSLEPGRRTAAGALPALAASVVYAVALIGLGMSELPELTTVAATRLTSVLLVLPVFLIAVRRLPDRAATGSIAGCGLLDGVGFVAFAFAAAAGPLSVASVTATQWGTVAALIGIIALRERLHPNQYVGIVVTLAAVTGLGLVG